MVLHRSLPKQAELIQVSVLLLPGLGLGMPSRGVV